MYRPDAIILSVSILLLLFVMYSGAQSKFYVNNPVGWLYEIL